MSDQINIARLTDLVGAVAVRDAHAGQRLAAQTVVRLLAGRGAVAEVGDYAGFASADVLGADGSRLVITPLFDWLPEDDDPSEDAAAAGSWEFAVRGTAGRLVPRPDGDDTFGCADIWYAATCGLQFGRGLAAAERVMTEMAALLGWSAVAVDRTPPAAVSPGLPAAEFAIDPYPGTRPAGSFVIDVDARCWPVRLDEARPSGWIVDAAEGPACLDSWLAERGATPLAGRVPLLGYGSNACPGKVLRNGTPLPSVHLACTIEDVASVWCAGHTRAGQVPVTLAVAPGHEEAATVMMCDRAELAVLDRVEGRAGRFYDLVLLGRGRVVLENGARVPVPAAYVGGRPERWPVLVGGRPVLRVDIDQAQLCGLDAVLRAQDVAAPEELGRVLPAGTYPHPGECVPAVFVYGTLKPGQARWPLLAPFVTGAPIDGMVMGQLRDGGHGYPALNAVDDAKAPGVLCTCRSDEMASLLSLLDDVEGVPQHLYSRQARDVDGTLAWVYVADRCAGQGTPIDAW